MPCIDAVTGAIADKRSRSMATQQKPLNSYIEYLNKSGEEAQASLCSFATTTITCALPHIEVQTTYPVYLYISTGRLFLQHRTRA